MQREGLVSYLRINVLLSCCYVVNSNVNVFGWPGSLPQTPRNVWASGEIGLFLHCSLERESLDFSRFTIVLYHRTIVLRRTTIVCMILRST